MENGRVMHSQLLQDKEHVRGKDADGILIRN